MVNLLMISSFRGDSVHRMHVLVTNRISTNHIDASVDHFSTNQNSIFQTNKTWIGLNGVETRLPLILILFYALTSNNDSKYNH